jgi:hypothetical protein
MEHFTYPDFRKSSETDEQRTRSRYQTLAGPPVFIPVAPRVFGAIFGYVISRRVEKSKGPGRKRKMGAQGAEIRRLNAAEYERLCREACAEYRTEVTVEALLFAICKRVYHHIYGYKRDLVLPYAVGPRQEIYKSALRKMVSEAQSEPIDALEVVGHYIKGI